MQQDTIRAGIVPYSWRSNDNPYQKLFADALEGAGVSVARMKCKRLFPIEEIRQSELQVVHMDWAHKFYGGRNRLFAQFKTMSFRRRLKALGSRKLVWTIHNLFRHEATMPSRREMSIRRWIASQCDALVALSNCAADQVRELLMPPDSVIVRVVPHGHYADVYPNEVSQAEARRHLGLEDVRRCVLFLGLLRRYKGVDLLIRAFSRVGKRGDALVIAGLPSFGFDVVELERMARDLCPEGCRILIKAQEVDDSDIQFYYNACDIVALPFRRVLNSGSVLLAMSFGKCVVSPRLGSIPEIACPDGYFGYDSGQTEGLAEALRDAMDQPDLHERGKASLAFARERYDWRDIGSRVRGLYEELLMHP